MNKEVAKKLKFIWPLKIKKLKHFLLWGLIIFSLILSFLLIKSGILSIQSLKDHFSFVRKYQETHPIYFLVVFSLSYILVAALALPGATFFTLYGGALFGLFQGTIIISITSTLGSTCAFLISRFLFQKSIEKRYRDKLQHIKTHLTDNGAAYLFFLRLNPIFPFFLINSLMGLTPLSTWTFFWVSQLGMLPGTLLYVNAGTQLSQIQSLDQLASPQIIMSFFAIGLFPLIIKKWFNLRKTLLI